MAQDAGEDIQDPAFRFAGRGHDFRLPPDRLRQGPLIDLLVLV